MAPVPPIEPASGVDKSRADLATASASVWLRQKLWAALVALGAVALVWVLEDFSLFQLTLAYIYAIAILGLTLLTGYSGQFSLGHSAFYALGAYSAAILITNAGVAYYWTLLPAGLVCLLGGYLFGLPARRLSGLHLALATFALAVATPQILKYPALAPWTGGVQGIDLPKPQTPLVGLSDDQWLYVFTLAVLFLMLWVARNLVHSRTGRAMIAIRDNPIAAQAMGIHTGRYKALTFGVSAMFTGIAGALSASAIQFVAPDSFSFLLAINFLVGLVVGGVVSIPGAVFGGLFILYVPNLTEQFEGLAWALFGAILIVVVYLMPGGAAELVKTLVGRLMRAWVERSRNKTQRHEG
jgi:branched-chain amino acid transport system permease protein